VIDGGDARSLPVRKDGVEGGDGSRVSGGGEPPTGAGGGGGRGGVQPGKKKMKLLGRYWAGR
jgi:hypothetical protein